MLEALARFLPSISRRYEEELAGLPRLSDDQDWVLWWDRFCKCEPDHEVTREQRMREIRKRTVTEYHDVIEEAASVAEGAGEDDATYWQAFSREMALAQSNGAVGDPLATLRACTRKDGELITAFYRRFLGAHKGYMLRCAALHKSAEPKDSRDIITLFAENSGYISVFAPTLSTQSTLRMCADNLAVTQRAQDLDACAKRHRRASALSVTEPTTLQQIERQLALLLEGGHQGETDGQ